MRTMNPIPIRSTSGHTLWVALVSALLAAGLGRAEPGAAPAAPAPSEEKKIEAKSPGEVASQLCALLASRRTPWQIYDSYIAIFQDYAVRQSRVPVATAEAQQLRQRWVAHYQGMAHLLQRMQEYAKLRDDIKRNLTDLPPHERQDAFREAGQQFDRLFQQFVAMGRRLPGFRIDEEIAKRPAPGPRAFPEGDGPMIW